MANENDDSKMGRPRGTGQRHPRWLEIEALMETHGFCRQDLIDILGVSTHTVLSWMRPVDNTAHRSPPVMAVNALRMAARQRHLV